MDERHPTFVLDDDANTLGEPLQRSASGSQPLPPNNLRNRADGYGSRDFSTDFPPMETYEGGSSVGQKRMNEEREIDTTAATHENVLRLAELQIRRRRVRQYEQFRESLSSASNSLDCLRMITNLEKFAAAQSYATEEDRKLNEGLRDRLAQVKARLNVAVHAQNIGRVSELQGELESLMLRHDREYIERIQEAKSLLKKAVKENQPPRPPPTWREDLPYRLLSLIRGDRTGERQVVSKDEQRWWVSRIAWFTAITLMILAITFISIDFYQSKVNPALSSSLSVFDRLQLPVVWGCISYSFIPSFLNQRFSREFVGTPTWVLRSYTNRENGEVLTYPWTHDQVAEDVIIGPEGKCGDAMHYMSARNIRNGMRMNNNSTRCYSCYRVGNLKPVWVDYRSTLNRSDGALTLEFSMQVELEFCLEQGAMWNSFMRESIRRQLVTHGRRLVDKGALVVLDPPGDYEFAITHGFHAIQEELRNHGHALAIAEVYCNLYLFSGVFYPVRPSDQARFQFDNRLGAQAWTRLSDPGVYLPIHSNYRIVEESDVNVSRYFSDMYNVSSIWQTINTKPSLMMYSLENRDNVTAQPGIMDFSAVLKHDSNALLLYAKKIEQGSVSYASNYYEGTMKKSLIVYPYRSSNVSFDFASFNVQQNKKVFTTTPAEFLTDLFEYVGLFTGVCAYSLLVSPARIYLRRAQKQRTNTRG